MTISSLAEPQRKALRSAGLLYLLLVISAPFGLIYVPGKLAVSDDAAATAERIRAYESLLRIGIGSELFHQAVAVFLVLALYRFFKPVNEDHAKLLVILGALVSVPIMFLNVLNEIAALILVSGADFLAAFEKGQLDSLASLFIRLHEQGINVAAVFWGLWLFPFGILVVRSGFIPRVLGILLYIAGSAHVVSSFTTILLPQYGESVSQVALVPALGEMAIVFWFLINGLRLLVTERGR